MFQVLTGVKSGYQSCCVYKYAMYAVCDYEHGIATIGNSTCVVLCTSDSDSCREMHF